MFKSLKVAAAIAALSLGAGAAQAGPVLVVDSFTTTQGSLVDNTINAGGGVWSSVSTAGTDILGGQRDLYVESTSGGPIGGETTEGKVVVALNGDGVLRTDATGGASGVVKVRWDGSNTGAATNVAGLGSLDLLTQGYGAFGFNFLTSSAGIPVTLTVWSGGNAYSSTKSTFNTGTSFSSILFNFGGFGAADFDDIGAIELSLDASNAAGFDVFVTMVNAIPEPGSIALLGAGLLGLAGLRRRKAA